MRFLEVWMFRNRKAMADMYKERPEKPRNRREPVLRSHIIDYLTTGLDILL